jgi:hypothetical protein
MLSIVSSFSLPRVSAVQVVSLNISASSGPIVSKAQRNVSPIDKPHSIALSISVHPSAADQLQRSIETFRPVSELP